VPGGSSAKPVAKITGKSGQLSFISSISCSPVIELFRRAIAGNPRLYYIHLALAGALGLRGDLDEAKTELAEAIRLSPGVNSLAQLHAHRPWDASPQQSELREQTLIAGLRRIGFPDE
jgi:adenylate cyclase